MSEVNEEAVIEDYKNKVPLAKIYEKHKISAFDLGIILGKHNVEKRSRAIFRYPENVYGITKGYSTYIPVNLRKDFKPGQKLKWTKLGKGEWKVTVIA